VARYIAIAGNMGSGKTSLVEFLRRRYDIRAVSEPNDENPYLADFYGDMARWGLQSQLFFLTRKAALHRTLQRGKKTGLLDRTIYEDAEIFAQNLYLTGQLAERDHRLYRMVYRELVRGVEQPSLLIFLRCRLPTLRKRIAMRGREMEQKVSNAYLWRLNHLYGMWAAHYKRSPVITINTDRIDYVSDLTQQIQLLKTVESVVKAG